MVGFNNLINNYLKIKRAFLILVKSRAMSSESDLCYLRCMKNPEKRIILPHNKVISIGRTVDTGIVDVFISREHVKCTANINEKHVLVQTVGKCYSGCNGYILKKGENYTLKHGDILELRIGFHEYQVVFEELENNEPQPKKMKTNFSIFNSSKKENNDMKFVHNGNWESIDKNELLIYTSENCYSKSLVACFDIDGTIVKTKSGARFPKDKSDWMLYLDNIPKKLNELYNNDYKIVFFTNQSGVGQDAKKIKDFKEKIENIIQKIEVPIQAYIATGKTFYRKPMLGMWDILCQEKNDKIAINLKDSFYVGDAAGREKNWAPKRNKDHSLCDRLFAMNIGLTFHTPEEYFLQARSVPYVMPEFDPKNLVQTENYPEIKSEKLQVILMVGGPGSGKSLYCKNELIPKGFVHVNRDTLGSWQKCVKKLEECLHDKKSVVVDNTNPDKESRQRFIVVAKKFGVDCVCFYMSTSIKHCKHNNRFRELTDKSHAQVSDIIINSYKKNFQEPELSEGFSKIVKIPFVPKFDKPDHEKLYKMFLLES